MYVMIIRVCYVLDYLIRDQLHHNYDDLNSFPPIDQRNISSKPSVDIKIGRKAIKMEKNPIVIQILMMMSKNIQSFDLFNRLLLSQAKSTRFSLE